MQAWFQKHLTSLFNFHNSASVLIHELVSHNLDLKKKNTLNHQLSRVIKVLFED